MSQRAGQCGEPQERASSGPNAKTPVIALTANVMEDQCRAYAAAGMDAWAPKPIDAQRLLEAIAAVIESRAAPVVVRAEA